ncbi:CoA-acylating methylmalonate-semialdehyde dehydrogenase [Spirillospora sp. NPDC052242]
MPTPHSALITHWIAGRRHAGTGGRRGPVTDPATGRTTAEVVLAEPADVDAAVASAAAAGRAWAAATIAARTRVLFAFRQLVDARRDELAALITAEHGKVRSDALGEVARGLDVVEFACGIGHLLKGDASTNVSTGVDVRDIRQPLGVVGIISPFNFPAMVPMWFFPIAVAAGNAVVLKPSEKDPSASLWLAERWKEAGLPDGVFTVVQGDKTAVDALVDHPDVAAVSFVGSTPVARYVYGRAAAAGKRVQALGGAKNHMVVMPDADLDDAADAAVNAGFGSAGERCMAVSVVVAVGGIADELVEKIASRTRALRTGDGAGDADMGPLVTREHRDRVASYVAAGEAAGATVVVDGRTVEPDGDAGGFWLGPTLLDRVTPAMTVYTDEIFGPVLGVVRVETYAEALELINGNAHGNGTAIFTRDGAAARAFENDVQVGMVGINVPIPVPAAFHSFGGWKSSLFGDAHAYGADGVRFYTRGKVVTSRWPDPAAAPSGGVELAFPSNR